MRSICPPDLLPETLAAGLRPEPALTSRRGPTTTAFSAP
jgi:hypothetical protein